MARLKPSCLCIRSVMLFALLAMLGLVFAPPPVVANCGPEYYVNPNNTAAADETPWVDQVEGQASREVTGSGCMYMQIVYWLVDSGIIDVGQDLKAQSTGSGNRERNTADELSQY